jgi:hypothetical protein
MPTLSTYNTWMQLSRLQRMYHFRYLKLRFVRRRLSALRTYAKLGRSLLVSCYIGSGGQHCISSMDSDLEAFSHYPTHGSFAALAFQPAALPIM